MNEINAKKIAARLLMASVIAVPTMLPADATAQTSHRQKSKNQWRNLGIAGGVLGAAGLLTHNRTLAIGGLAGGAYSAYRYEQDRKSQRREQDRWRRDRYRSYRYGRAQRFSSSPYYRTRHGYASSWHHDNGLHNGWYKNGKWHH